MGNFEDIFGDLYNGYRGTSKYNDDMRMDIVLSKHKYEESLDEMWSVYSKGIPWQLIEYNKAVNDIKNAGLKVLRNSSGKHKIVVPEVR